MKNLGKDCKWFHIQGPHTQWLHMVGLCSREDRLSTVDETPYQQCYVARAAGADCFEAVGSAKIQAPPAPAEIKEDTFEVIFEWPRIQREHPFDK